MQKNVLTSQPKLSDAKSLNLMFSEDYLRNNIKNYSKLDVFLKRSRLKGLGLFAKRNFEKGEIVCYYVTELKPLYRASAFGGKYAVHISEKDGSESKELAGDLTTFDVLKVNRGKCNLGYLVNEPSPSQKVNCFLGENTKMNWKNKCWHEIGDIYTFYIKTYCPVKKGQEFVWYYGDAYKRDYQISERWRPHPNWKDN